MKLDDKLVIEEYRMLREELKTNTKFVFERPILIAATSLLAKDFFTVDLPGLISPASLTSMVIIVILFFNLWFTHNRLKSSARIVAYIYVFIEGKYRKKWIGWESSLVEYRKLISAYKHDVPELHKRKTKIDSRKFYGNIFYLHIFLAAFVTAINVFINNPFLKQSTNFTGEIILILIFIGFSAIALKKWNPGNMQSLINDEINNWLFIAGKIKKQ